MNANRALLIWLTLTSMLIVSQCAADEQQDIQNTLKEMGATNITVNSYENWSQSQTIKPYPIDNYVARADFGEVNATFYLKGNMTSQQMKDVFQTETRQAFDEAANLKNNGFTDIKVRLLEQNWAFYEFYDHPINRVTIVDAKKYGIEWNNYWTEEKCCGDMVTNIVPLRARSCPIAVNVTDFAAEAELLKPTADRLDCKLMIGQSSHPWGMITYQEVGNNLTETEVMVKSHAEEANGYQVAIWFEIPYDFMHAGEIPAKIEGIENKTKFRFER